MENITYINIYTYVHSVKFFTHTCYIYTHTYMYTHIHICLHIQLTACRPCLAVLLQGFLLQEGANEEVDLPKWSTVPKNDINIRILIWYVLSGIEYMITYGYMIDDL